MKTNSSINNIKIARQTINRKLKGIDVEKLAVETGFQKRKSRKIRPIDLLISYFLICLTGKGSISLKGWAAKLSFLIGDTVSSVAIFKKIRDEQIEFLRKVLEKAIGKKAAVNERVAESLKFFNNILIQDSTCLRLNSNLETSYPGSRNQNSSTALMRINVIYDLLKGTFRHLTLSSFRNNDLMHSKDIIDYAQKGDLVLRDQGYFKMESLKQMDQKGIYFISRYKAPVKIYKDNKQIDLYRFFNNRNFIDKRFEVTSKYKYCLRIVAIKLPSEVVEQRKRKVVNKKYIHSKPYMKLLEYAIFITNVEESKLKIKQIMDIYRLRWRIEIVFKFWKTNIGITDVVELTNKLRVDSYIYAMLIYIVLFVTDFSRYLNELPNLSLMKFSKFTTDNFSDILYLWIENRLNSGFIKKLIKYFCQYDSRSDRLNFNQLLWQLS